MLTLQHSLVTLLSVDGDIQKFRDEIAYVLLPDAIRRYTGARQTSHFECNPSNGITSWLRYPLNLKDLSKENIDMYIDSCLSPNITPCCIGETTQIEEFFKHNEHLPILYYLSVQKHLIQDFIYDDFIRSIINTSDKYDGIFYFKSNKLDSTEVRKVITDIEEDGFTILARIIYEKYRICVNQDWFRDNVYEVLLKVYSKDLADGTYNYMKIREDINNAITTHNWKLVKSASGVDISNYNKMYSDVIDRCKQISNMLNMKTYECVQKNRDSSLAIKSYILRDCTGEHIIISPDKLKFYVMNNSINCINLGLTKDNRLIDKDRL